MASPMANIYQRQRETAGQRIGAQAQESSDAMKRRFASLGGLNSGAAIKAQQLNDENAMRQKEEAVAGINAQEAADTAQREQRQQEIQQAQGFQAGEAEKQRAFAKATSEQDRAFQEKIFAADQGSKLRQLDLAEKQFGASRQDADFQRRLQRYQAGQSGGLFGGGGFLGLGIGAGPADI